MIRRTAPLLLLAFLLGCGGERPSAEAPAEKVLRFSAIPDQNSTELAEKFKPLADHLSTRLGVRVEYVPSRDYQATVEMFRNGDIQMAWFGGLTGVQARHAVPGARAIAQGAEDRAYTSYFIANRATGLARSESFPAEIASRTFTFGSESSTSGRLMPEFFIRQATGKPPAQFFTTPPGYSGSHDRTLELVASGQYETGVVNYKVYDDRVKNGSVDPDLVRVLWQTPPYADYNFTVRPDLDETIGAGFTQKLQQALVAIDDPTLLVALPRERLVAASNEEYEGIRRVAQDLGMIR